MTAGRLKTPKPRVQPLVPRTADGKAMRWADPRRASSTARGYGWAWEKLRARILKRDRGLCIPCEREGRITAATAVDHIVNKALGGSDDPGNLQAICQRCHAEKTRRESSTPGGEGKSW
jgi:5-methylcytosine-specific restriction protein A